MAKTHIDWTPVKAEYIYDTTTSIRGLAKKYNLSASTVEKRCRVDGWVQQRNEHKSEVGQISRAHIRDIAVADQLAMYGQIRASLVKLIDAVCIATDDAEQFFRHVLTGDVIDENGQRKRVSGDRVLGVINGRNFAEIARGLSDIVSIARTLDGVIDPVAQAKLDLDRERFELEKRKAGLSDDVENESGIALLPAVDETLLDNALPDPGSAA